MVYNQVENFRIMSDSDDMERKYKDNFKEAVFRFVDGTVDMDYEKSISLILEVLR